MPPKGQQVAARTVKREVIPNAQRRATTRATVIRAAAEAFDEFGYIAATLDDIVERTGLTKGAVYFHFASKEALAIDLITRHYERLQEIVATVGNDEDDALERLVAMTFAVADASRDDPVLRAGARLAVEREVFSAEIENPYDWWIQVLSGLTRKARREHVLVTEVTPAAVARIVATFFVGSMHLASAADRYNDLRRRLDEFWDILEPAIRA